jgi:hypothetical protein
VVKNKHKDGQVKIMMMEWECKYQTESCGGSIKQEQTQRTAVLIGLVQMRKKATLL